MAHLLSVPLNAIWPICSAKGKTEKIGKKRRKNKERERERSGGRRRTRKIKPDTMRTRREVIMLSLASAPWPGSQRDQ